MSCKVVETNLDEGVLNSTEWVHRWAVGNTGFHRSRHDRFLDENEELMFGGKTKSLFMPLCGKTPDILWMYQKGHTVCGVEIAEQPIKELFEENKIEVEVHDIENVGKLYQSKDGQLKFYVTDLFDLSLELCGQYDVIWDSKSITAINIADYELYRDLLLSLMKKDGLYFLSTLEYDPAVWPGPPHTIPDKTVKEVYSGVCDIELLEESNRAGQDINAPQSGGASSDGMDIPKLTSASAAIKTSSYVFARWYKMTLKSA